MEPPSGDRAAQATTPADGANLASAGVVVREVVRRAAVSAPAVRRAIQELRGKNLEGAQRAAREAFDRARQFARENAARALGRADTSQAVGVAYASRDLGGILESGIRDP